MLRTSEERDKVSDESWRCVRADNPRFFGPDLRFRQNSPENDAQNHADLASENGEEVEH